MKDGVTVTATKENGENPPRSPGVVSTSSSLGDSFRESGKPNSCHPI